MAMTTRQNQSDTVAEPAAHGQQLRGSREVARREVQIEAVEIYRCRERYVDAIKNHIEVKAPRAHNKARSHQYRAPAAVCKG